MRAVEFPAKMSTDGTITLPDDIKQSLSVDEDLRIVIFRRDYDDREEELAFMRAGIDRFFADDCEADKIYDRI